MLNGSPNLKVITCPGDPDCIPEGKRQGDNASCIKTRSKLDVNNSKREKK